jgi:micrococcal nuclease
VRRAPVLPALLLSLLAACNRQAPPTDGVAVVDHVVDGDTVVVDLGGRVETLRLIGVDTPETVDPDQPPECFGPEASERTKTLLPPGTEVRLTRDVEARDRYDRLLVYVERAEDGLFVNLDLVAGGWADDYPFPPNVAHERDFALAASDARRQGLGLWGACGNADTPAA